MGASFSPIQYNCDAGEYLPADTLGCVACLHGYTCAGGIYPFDEIFRHGIVINTYTCNDGYYLPANALGCSECPVGATCVGGTHIFNATVPQGIAHNIPFTQNQNDLCSSPYIFARAEFTPNEYACDAGYYLPADAIDCVVCPAGNACAGGTYTFNEAVTQGIVACTNGTTAPAGAAVCYEHILHVGNDIVYLRSNQLTQPSLNVQIGNDVFYANMTNTPTYMNENSTHYFRIQSGNNDYYVCDDTTYSPHIADVR